MTRRGLGKLGEDIACRYLSDRGYTIVSRNIYSRFGEIDILAKQNEELVFIEVKTRALFPELDLDKLVSFKKKQKLLKTSLEYLEKLGEKPFWRWDLIFVLFNASNRLSSRNPEIIHTMLRNIYLTL